MRARLEILRNLLCEDGLIFAHIDDEEFAYLTIMMDEVFGRSNRQNIVAVKMSEATGVKMSHAKSRFPKTKEFILVYRKKNPPVLSPIKVPLEAWNNEYKEILIGADQDALNELKTLMEEDTCSGVNIERANAILSNIKIQSLSKFFKENEIPDDEQDAFRWENAWRIVQAVGAGSIKSRAIDARIAEQDLSAVLSARKKLYVFKTEFNEESRDPRIRLIFADKYLQYNPGDFWRDIKTTGGVGQEGGVHFPNGKKPEQLLQRIIGTCTKPGDLVLDSFAGSGTTGAVAHKMGRRWIMVELGEHAKTHIVPRMQTVIDGTDKSGVTEATAWKGGGGYRFFRIAPSLLQKDVWGNWVISKDYNAEMLAEAMCKHFNYVYAPSDEAYWMHGHASESAFIYVTTASLTFDQLRAISDEVGEDRSLLICCMAYEAQGESLDNLTLKKIPRVVLDRCEWGKDDYSLRIDALPMAEEVDALEDASEPTTATRKVRAAAEPDLFGEGK